MRYIVVNAQRPLSHLHSIRLFPATLKMFVPRAVRLKGVKEPQRPKVVKRPGIPQASTHEANSKDALVQAMDETSMNSPAQHDTASDVTAPTRGPRFTIKPITPEYIAQLAAGIELIFTDYAHQEEGRSKWLRDRYRLVDGADNCGYYSHKQILCLLIIRQMFISLPSLSTPTSRN